MARAELRETLRQVILMITDIDKLMGQLVEECKAKGADAVGSFQREMDEVMQSNEDVHEEFYELLVPYYQGDNLFDLPLPDLQQELFRVIQRRPGRKLVGFHEGLLSVRMNLDKQSDMIFELMRKLKIVPRSFFVKLRFRQTYLRSRKRKRSHEEMENQESFNKVPRFFSPGEKSFDAMDAAVYMYGFLPSIASEIKDSLGHRKLIENETRFDEHEGTAMVLLAVDDGDEGKEKDPDGVNWVRVHILKRRFQELKKKIFEKEDGNDGETKMLSASAAAAGAIAGADAGKVTPEALRATFRKVIRNWVFHVEDVFFNFIIYELYYMLACNERAEAIFEQYKGTLKELKQSHQGMVPITVHKTIYMLENPIGFKVNGVVKRAPTVSGIGWEILDKMMELEEMMEQIHEIMLRLRGLLLTACLSSMHQIIQEEEAASYEHALEQLEDEIREIERKIKRAKSEHSPSWHIPEKD